MRAPLLFVLSIIIPAVLHGQTASHPVLPAPRTISVSAPGLRLDSTLTVVLPGYRDPRLERAVTRMLDRLEGRIAQPLGRTPSTAAAARLQINVRSRGYDVPDLREDESYAITATAGRVVLDANTVVGAMRGMETLLQLVAADSAGHYLPVATITDSPRFPWRGVNIDASRHFHPVDAIKRTLDGMAVVKLNVLHWHLSDDQGFRAESRTFPKLTELGSDGRYYTQEQMRDVVAYAADRGIRVVPEFDVPGHTTAWMVGHPELASAPGPYRIERRWGVFHPTMDPTRESTYEFLDRFIGELVAIFPDRYWHIGGDEVDPTQWKTSTSIQEWMTRNSVKDVHALQTHFNKRLFAILEKHGREPVGWDEILQADLPKNAVIQSWRGMKGLTESVAQGRRAILSAPYYLDHIKTSAEMYLDDPMPAGLAPEQQALVLGGEACMWAEYITTETLDSRLWPRLGAVAERFWSPASVRDVGDLYRRLELVSARLEEAGTLHESHTARMVRRFAGGDDAATLTSLLDYARPRGFAGRGTNQLSPLTRLVDAARPDPFGGWRMQALAKRAAQGDIAAARALRDDFARMARFEMELRAMQHRVPMARDGLPVAGALRTLARLGNEALDARERRARGGAAWRARADSTLRTIEGKTFGLLRPVGAEAVRALL